MINIKEILLLYPEFTHVSGPHTDTGGRLYLNLINSNLKQGTKGYTYNISYPKAMMEIKLGERIYEPYTVDHIDRNFLNNDYSNLRVVTRSQNTSDDNKRVKVEPVKCPECGLEFMPSRGQRNSAKDKAGPFCSRVCSGKYGARVLYEGKRLERTAVIKTYFYIDKHCKSDTIQE